MNPVVIAFIVIVGSLVVAAGLSYLMLLSAYHDYGLDRHGNPMKPKK